ncbi:MAG: hypothetical protein R3250_14480 [Melioribacteraceae bacterium]|nr:hypothetical protein [Melioribacteraceae bacterium]
MVRRNRDAKFVIYQVLYIFVITVLALKGAEINLGEVVNKEEVVEKGVRDSLLSIVDSLSELGLKLNIEIESDFEEENLILKEKLNDLNKQVASLSKRAIKSQNPKRTIKKSMVSDPPFPFSSDISLLSFATNSLANNGNYKVQIMDPVTNQQIVQIEPQQTKSFELNNQTDVIIKYGTKSDQVKVKQNQPPEIQINKATTKMDRSDIYVMELQRTTCFNVIIRDERIDQIKISYSGPISVNGPNVNKKGEHIYSVSLRLAANERSFESWADKNDHLVESDGRYKTNFFFTAFDTKSKQKVKVGENFYFTEFSK